LHVNCLNVDIVKSYAMACRDLYYYMGVLGAEGYDLLVVPSRGAYPFLNSVRGYAYELLEATSLGCNRGSPGRVRELFLPFTADISRDQAIAPAAIRKYWARVLKAILVGNTADAAYRFYQFVRSMAPEFPLQPLNMQGGGAGKFMFVDTVISGRAISEIVQGFDAYGLTECHYLLLLDNNGDDLKPEYRQRLDQLENAGRATLIKVAKIFTEDEGPAMSGIWTITIPELMDAAAEMIPDLANAGETGAALAYWEVRKREDGSNLSFTLSNAMLSSLLYSAVLGKDTATASFLEDFQEHISQAHLQDQAKTMAVAAPVVRRNIDLVESIDVSGSHVVRVYFGVDKARTLVNEFLRT
jgi:hypothetical protein